MPWPREGGCWNSEHEGKNKDVSICINVISFLLARRVHPSHRQYAGSSQMLTIIMFRSLILNFAQIRHKMWRVWM
jgi:hypothetical protein